MEHGAFVTWMLFWPLVDTCRDYLRSKFVKPVEISEAAEYTALIAEFGFYLGVAYLLY